MELSHFQKWLQDFQPGFTDLSEADQVLKARQHFDHFLQTGRLPPLPQELGMKLSYQGRSFVATAVPRVNVQLWVQKLKSQLLQSFLHDPTNDFTGICHRLKAQVEELVTQQYIDDGVRFYVDYVITENFNILLGVFQLIYNLLIHNFEASLVVDGLDRSTINYLLVATEEVIMKSGYIYTSRSSPTIA